LRSADWSISETDVFWLVSEVDISIAISNDRRELSIDMAIEVYSEIRKCILHTPVESEQVFTDRCKHYIFTDKLVTYQCILGSMT